MGCLRGHVFLTRPHEKVIGGGLPSASPSIWLQSASAVRRDGRRSREVVRRRKQCGLAEVSRLRLVATTLALGAWVPAGACLCSDEVCCCPLQSFACAVWVDCPAWLSVDRLCVSGVSPAAACHRHLARVCRCSYELHKRMYIRAYEWCDLGTLLVLYNNRLDFTHDCRCRIHPDHSHPS